MRWQDYVLVIAILAVPIPVIVSLCFADIPAPWERVILFIRPVPEKTPRSTRNIPLYVAAWLLLMMAIIVANRWLDTSPQQETVVLVIKKDVTRSRHHIIFYNFTANSPVPPPLPFSLCNTERFSESEDSYRLHVKGQKFDAIVPNHTEVVIKLHKGYFSIPWRENEYKVRLLQAKSSG